MNRAAAQERNGEEAAVHAAKRRKLQQHGATGRHQAQQKALLPSANSPVQDTVFDGRTSAERQAALSLAQFAHSDPESQLTDERVVQLISTLTVSLVEDPSLTSSLTVCAFPKTGRSSIQRPSQRPSASRYERFDTDQTRKGYLTMCQDSCSEQISPRHQPSKQRHRDDSRPFQHLQPNNSRRRIS